MGEGGGFLGPLFIPGSGRRLDDSISERHASGLEVAAVGDGGYLAVGLLAGQPDLEVVADARREADVAAAEEHAAVGQLQGLEQRLGVSHHGLVLLARALRGNDLHELDLVELVLPQQTAGVSAVRARLGAEGRRVAHVFDGQLLGVEELVAVQVRDRDLGRGDEEGVLARH